MAHRNAASVLPDPVGAMTRVFFPPAMASHASACAAVGAANVPVNHSRVSGLKRSSGSMERHIAMVPPPTDKPAISARQPSPSVVSAPKSLGAASGEAGLL